MPTKKTENTDSITVAEVNKQTIEATILGDRPLILNRLSQKVGQQLLMPPRKKNAVERATTLKHDPMAEFKDSPYTLSDPNAATYLAMPAGAFKKSMMAAALDLPGTKRTQIGRLVWVDGDLVEIYGVPQILLAAVRSADINRTPDIRTRAIVPQWACRLSITYVKPLMSTAAVTRLLAAAGLYIGIGDWRNEKGSGTFGAFKVVDPDNERVATIMAGGRAAQVAAMAAPEAYNTESLELLSWFDAELGKRKLQGV